MYQSQLHSCVIVYNLWYRCGSVIERKGKIMLPQFPIGVNRLLLLAVSWALSSSLLVSSFHLHTRTVAKDHVMLPTLTELRAGIRCLYPRCKLNTHHEQQVSSFALQSSRDSQDAESETSNKYSRDVQLRVEAESPFRKVRFFVYASLGAAAATSFLISSTRVLAGLNGINADLMDESLFNVGVDVAGIVVLALLWQRDTMAQNSRLKRAAKGAELAKLKVRVSKSMMMNDDAGIVPTNDARFTTSLATLRRGRGMEKRVVIAVGSSDRIQTVMNEATDLQDTLTYNDLLIVPIVLSPPDGTITPIMNVDVDTLPECIALPVSGSSAGSWKVVIDDELEEATKQGIDAYKEGFCVILKKNGRVGQRTRGIYLPNMVGEVTQRREAGMDTVNI
jgi:Low psii accumulation1 / Rep27